MLSSAVPANFPIPFANSAGGGYKRVIPQASQIGITPGAASLNDGFPPLTFLPISAGGVPPFGQDFNGLLNEITAAVQWAQAGMPPVYDAAFQTAIGGYPKGAILQKAGRLTGLWVSTAENNVTDPDTGGAGWVDFATFATNAFSFFDAYAASAYSQVCSSAVATKIICATAVVDTLSEYDTGTGVFSPLSDGYYQFFGRVLGSTVNVGLVANLAINNGRWVRIYKTSDNTELTKMYANNPVANDVAVGGLTPPIHLVAGEGVYMAYKAQVGDTVVQESPELTGTVFGGWRVR